MYMLSKSMSPQQYYYFDLKERRRNDEGVRYSALESRSICDVFKSQLSLDDDLSSNEGFNTSYNSNSYNTSYKQNFSHGSSPCSSSLSDDNECFSRKVFVGGLPPDIDEEEIHTSFCQFGPLTVDWPHKVENKSHFPPKGYAFLRFKNEISVQRLIEMCIMHDGKLYICVSSPTMRDKPVQIRPWNLADANFSMDDTQPLDPRKTIFVGGVPRPLRAVELAMLMDRLYGGVCYAGIDVDPELKYPKGAARIAFSNQQSYIAAISARFIQLQHGEINKRVEVKPYVLDDQMCDECHGLRCNSKFAPFFCSNITCLQYYCEKCWAIIHSKPGRKLHKPLVKEAGERHKEGLLGLTGDRSRDGLLKLAGDRARDGLLQLAGDRSRQGVLGLAAEKSRDGFLGLAGDRFREGMLGMTRDRPREGLLRMVGDRPRDGLLGLSRPLIPQKTTTTPMFPAYPLMPNDHQWVIN